MYPQWQFCQILIHCPKRLQSIMNFSRHFVKQSMSCLLNSVKWCSCVTLDDSALLRLVLSSICLRQLPRPISSEHDRYYVEHSALIESSIKRQQHKFLIPKQASCVFFHYPLAGRGTTGSAPFLVALSQADSSTFPFSRKC